MVQANIPPIDLSVLPPIFVSTTHLDDTAVHALEDRLIDCHAHLTYDIREARIVLTKVGRKRRAQFDLQAKGIWTEELPHARPADSPETREHPAKRQRQGHAAVKTDGRSNFSDMTGQQPDRASCQAPGGLQWTAASDTIASIKTEWFERSVRAGQILDIHEYLVFYGRLMADPNSNSVELTGPAKIKSQDTQHAASKQIVADVPRSSPSRSNHQRRRFDANALSNSHNSFGHGIGATRPPHLLLETTSEHDAGTSSDLPVMPDWVKKGLIYSCQRISPADSPNHEFIALLKEIKLVRLLTNDEIGVRAYSTSIAAICAYPHEFSTPREVLALPGCDAKIANLFVEYANTGRLQAVQDARDDPDLKVLRLFYEIWGVGALTAREYYYERGWRDLDDIVEFGWSSLQRVQQIGVKFYDEFLSPIPRDEVEQIASIIHRHAVKVRDQGIQSLLVGGYRRGKQQCGDVDIIVSHPDEAQTLNVINDIVSSLETEDFITHTLLLSLTTSNRGQKPLPYHSGGSGGGFDSLDKALVVWQDPDWSTKSSDLLKDPKTKNPNIHRRVDIIIAPWRAVGCAVAGWSGGTTFQRDLRRYVKEAHGWKFDSSGVRDRASGQVVDVERFEGPEGDQGRAKTMVEAEKRVFAAMGIEYREPWERCTG